MNSKSDEISKSINAKIELSIAIEELSQISERFLSSIHVVQNNSLDKIIPLEDAVEKARNLVAILKDIFEPRIVKKEPKSKSPSKKKSKQSQGTQNYGQHISDVVTDSENQLELITGFREGSICMIVNKIHRFGMKDSSRYPLIKWDCFKRKEDGCPAGFSTKIVNVEEVDKLCEGQEKRDKAKCPEAVHTLASYKNLNNHSEHLVEEPCTSKSIKKKKPDTPFVKIEAKGSGGSSDDNMDTIDESDVIMIDGYDSLESYTPVTGSKDHELQLVPGKTKGSIFMLVDKTHKFCMKDSSSYPLIKWACARRKACECNAAFSTRIVNAEVVDQVFFNEPARVKSKCVQAIHELAGFKSIDNHSNHAGQISAKARGHVEKVSKNGTSDPVVDNGGQSGADKRIVENVYPVDCVSDTTDDDDDDDEPDNDKYFDGGVESAVAKAPGSQDLADTSKTTNTSKEEKTKSGTDSEEVSKIPLQT